MSQGEIFFLEVERKENLLKVHVDVNYEFIVPCETIKAQTKIPPCGCLYNF